MHKTCVHVCYYGLWTFVSILSHIGCVRSYRCCTCVIKPFVHVCEHTVCALIICDRLCTRHAQQSTHKPFVNAVPILTLTLTLLYNNSFCTFLFLLAIQKGEFIRIVRLFLKTCCMMVQPFTCLWNDKWRWKITGSNINDSFAEIIQLKPLQRTPHGTLYCQNCGASLRNVSIIRILNREKVELASRMSQRR